MFVKNLPLTSPITFLAVRMGKWLQNGCKNKIFQTWIKTHPKTINAQNKHAIHHFWGMLALKSGLRFFCFGV